MTRNELFNKIRKEENLQSHSKFLKKRCGDQVIFNNYEGLIRYAKKDDRKAFNSVLDLYGFDLYTPLEVNHDLSDEQIHDYMFFEMKYNLDLEETLAKIADRRYIKENEKAKYGLVNSENQILISFDWDLLEKVHNHKLYFCAKKEKSKLHVGMEDRLKAAIFNKDLEPTCDYILKWGAFDHECNLIVPPQLDERPIPYDSNGEYLNKNYSQADYYLLKVRDEYGLLSKDGKLLANIELTKEQVGNLLLKHYDPDKCK